MTTHSVLRIDSSSSRALSATRQLSDLVIANLSPAHLTVRDLASDPLPIVDVDWVAGRMKAPCDRSTDEEAALALSDLLVAELMAAQTIVIGLPIYNFGIPAALKAWVDLIVRPGVTFAFTAEGIKPMVHGRKVILVLASASTAVGSDNDFATSYMRLILGFIGLTEVQVIAADMLAFDRQAGLEKAKAQIAALQN